VVLTKKTPLVWDQNHQCVSEHLSELLRHIHVCPDVCYAVLLEKIAPFILDELETTCVHLNKLTYLLRCLCLKVNIIHAGAKPPVCI